jgi:hypothetical protein
MNIVASDPKDSAAPDSSPPTFSDDEEHPYPTTEASLPLSFGGKDRATTNDIDYAEPAPIRGFLCSFCPA